MFWELPGPRRFVAEILDSLERQSHVLVLLPRTLGRTGLHTELERGVRGRALGELTVLLTDGSDPDPLDLLVARCGFRAATVEELLFDPFRPSRFLLLDDPGTSTAETWHEFLRRAASHTQVVGRSEVQFVVLVPGLGKPVVDDVFLSVHPWWGRLTQLDVDWATESRLSELPPASAAARYWIRALCRGLAVCDPVLASVLVEACPRGLQELTEVVARLDLFDGTPAIETNELPGVADRFRLAGLPSDGPMHRLWNEGLLDWQEDHGPVVLTRGLVARGDEVELRRRLWRGQLEVFMPIVERARLEVCGYLEQIHGGRWEGVLCRRAGLYEDGDVASEIGSLARLAGALKHSGHPLAPTVRRAIFGWRDIRNELAHWRPVTFDAFEEAVEASDCLLMSTG